MTNPVLCVILFSEAGENVSSAEYGIRGTEMLCAVLFDFDGTIADTIPAIRDGVNLTMREYGFPEHTLGETRTFINHGPRELIRRALPETYREDDAMIDRVLADYSRNYRSVCLRTDRTYDGIDRAIRTLHGDGWKIGVLSNKQDEMLRALTDAVLFPGTVDGVQGCVAGMPTKPDPYLTGLLTAALGVLPEECVMVGDSDVDLLTARAAGMRHVGVSWGYRDEAFLRKMGADAVAHDAGELLDLLQNYRKSEENT